MIWTGGRIVPDESVSVSVLDRSFEHGLGLFETFRTWNRRAPLLDRHLGRLQASASALGLLVDPSTLPNRSDVERLLDAGGGSIDDVVIRITTSGGLSGNHPAKVWMRAQPLPKVDSFNGRIRSSWLIPESDPLYGHKSLNYWYRRLIFERARDDGFMEDLGRDRVGNLLEGSRSNLFAVIDSQIVTPSLKTLHGKPQPLLPGIMRAVIMERAAELGMELIESPTVSIAAITTASELFLSNSGRGMIPVRSLEIAEASDSRITTYRKPGPITSALSDHLETWLRAEHKR